MVDNSPEITQSNIVPILNPILDTAPLADRSLLRNVYDGAILGSYSNNDSASSTVAQIAVGLLPWVGQAADARDTKAAYDKVQNGESGARVELGLALLGWIPLVGDLAKGALRPLKKPLGEFFQKASKDLTRRTESFTQTVSNWFSQPTIRATRLMQEGEGATDKFGNILYSNRGSRQEQALVRNHELVHSFFSPKFKLLQNFRADLRMSAYEHSSFMRYIEEAMAETYAQIKVNGVGAIPSGLWFPMDRGYVILKDVITEAAVGSLVFGGITYGVYVVADRSEEG